jgi:hypothetical protein
MLPVDRMTILVQDGLHLSGTVFGVHYNLDSFFFALQNPLDTPTIFLDYMVSNKKIKGQGNSPLFHKSTT